MLPAAYHSFPPALVEPSTPSIYPTVAMSLQPTMPAPALNATLPMAAPAQLGQQASNGHLGLPFVDLTQDRRFTERGVIKVSNVRAFCGRSSLFPLRGHISSRGG